MNRFMIGQHGAFDDNKYARDYHASFYGIEACMFESESEVNKLIAVAERDHINIGIHFPLRGWATTIRDPQFLRTEDKLREQFYQHMEEEFKYLQRIKPRYILFHYPKPVILEDAVDWSLWRYGDVSEYVYESEYSFEELKFRSEKLFAWLSDKAEEYSFIPVLEFDALNKYIYETDFLQKLLQKYQSVRLCLDTARLYLQERLDPSFDARKVIKSFAKYAEVIHVSNLQVREKLEIHHYPALPELKIEEGWGPVGEYMKLIQQENTHAKILFEHAPHLISDEELQRCYEWIEELSK